MYSVGRISRGGQRMGAECGYIGYESGGAQFQTAEMNTLSSTKVLKEAILCNLQTFSLTRSHWMNALEKLSNEEVKFILKATGVLVRSRFDMKSDAKVLPYFPYNFHAGNVPEQDEVTGLMLDEGFTPVPNFVWDPRFTSEHYETWLRRQFALWKSRGRTIHQLRIKNAGQQVEWTSTNVMAMVRTCRKEYKKVYGEQAEPILHIHNHNFNGLASHVAYEVLKAAQAEGFRTLVIDTAPPLMTHNNNLVVSKALSLPKDGLEALHYFNESAHKIWQTTDRFRDFLQVRIDPNTMWAGGTGSSDLAAAEKTGIARRDIEDAKALGAKISGLGGIVTPYSQWSMVIGYVCYKQGLRTYKAVEDHVNAGKLLNLPSNVLLGLYHWKTLLPRPALVEKILANQERADPAMFVTKESAVMFDPERLRQKQVQENFPNDEVNDEALMRMVSFGTLAVKTLQAESKGEDHNWLLRYPEIAYAAPGTVERGKTFAVKGMPVTYEGIEDISDTADVITTFRFEGQFIRVRTTSAEKASKISKVIENVLPTADPNNPLHIGAFMPGVIDNVFVKIGAVIKTGDPLYSVNSMKMVTAFKATEQHNGKVVKHIYVSQGGELQYSTQGLQPLVMALG